MSNIANRRLSSTTFEVEEVKIRRPVRAKGKQRARAAQASPLGWRGLSRKDWRAWQGVRLRYSHGANPCVIVNARGREWAYYWDTAVLDILRDVCNRDG